MFAPRINEGQRLGPRRRAVCHEVLSIVGNVSDGGDLNDHRVQDQYMNEILFILRSFVERFYSLFIPGADEVRRAINLVPIHVHPPH